MAGARILSKRDLPGNMHFAFEANRGSEALLQGSMRYFSSILHVDREETRTLAREIFQSLSSTINNHFLISLI